MSYPDVISRWCGLLTAVVLAGGTTAAALLVPGFSFASSDLFALRDPVQQWFWVFDFTMILAGVLLAASLWRLWHERNTLLHTLSILLILPVAAALIGIGVLPTDHDLYLSNAIGGLFLAHIIITLTATGNILNGAIKDGLTGFWTTSVHAFIWGGWLVGLLPESTAYPGFLAILLLSGWLFWTTDNLVDDGVLYQVRVSSSILLEHVRDRLPF